MSAATVTPRTSRAAAVSYDKVVSVDDSTTTSSTESPAPILIRSPRHLTTRALVCNFYQEHCLYLPPMAGWFLFSALLSSYNKFVFGEAHLNFPCPLLLTSIHFAAQWVVSWSLCACFPEFFGASRVNDMSWWEFLGISVPCGLVTSGDVGLSNLSLVTISITFYTMVKASSPIFVLCWAYFFGIIRITWSLVGVVMVIAMGEFLTVAGEVEFKFNGFVLCLMATILSGARWTLVQLKLQTLEPPLKTTIATMRVLSPFMFLSMLSVAMMVEHPWSALPGLYDSWDEIIFVIQLGAGGAVIAICMIMCEFYLIVHTNAMMLMIGGVIKEILTIFVGVEFFGDQLNVRNFLGCCVVFMGVILYKISLHMEKEEREKSRAVEDAEHSPLKDSSGRSDSDRSLNGSGSMQNGRHDGIEMRRSFGRQSEPGATTDDGEFALPVV